MSTFEEMLEDLESPSPSTETDLAYPTHFQVAVDLSASGFRTVRLVTAGHEDDDVSLLGAQWYGIVHQHQASDQASEIVEPVPPIGRRGRRSTDPVRRSAREVRTIFDKCAENWRSEVAHLSDLREIVLHPDYQQIIGLGPQVIPMIIDELRRETDHWFWALRAIVGYDVAENAETLREARDMWVGWYDRETSRHP